MSDEVCKLCRKNIGDKGYIFVNDYDFNENRFNDELCYVCNCYKQLTGIMKPVNDFELKKMNLIILMVKRINTFYKHEKFVQQKNSVSKWKNDRYLKQWYEKEFGKDAKFSYFKGILLNYFDNDGDFVDNEFVWKYSGDKHFIGWLNENYYILKNEIRWY